MKYIFINDETGIIKTHEIKRNKALAKLERDAIIIKVINNITYLADNSSRIANSL